MSLHDPEPIEIPDADPLRLAFFEHSDLGNAERLKALAGGKLKWIEDAQLWAWYDGKRFDLERGAIAAQRLAHAVVRHIRVEAAALYDLAARCEAAEVEAHELLTRLRGPKYDHGQLKGAASGLMKHALKSGSASMTAGMLRQARSDLAALSEEFDADPLAYNCLNGTLRFVNGLTGWSARLSPHDPADMLMQVADVTYDPDADCPFWKERLAIIQPDQVQRESLQTLYGYSLTGLTSDQAFYVHQGVGNDGKSTSHQALGALHGDYYRHSGVETFLEAGTARGGAEHRSDLVRLKGDIRFVTCDEPRKRSVWDGQVIKQVTGSLITARGANERKEVTYRPRFKLHPECNVIPSAPSDDKGFRRRFKLYLWTVSLPVAGEDGYIPIDQALSRIDAERSGVLNWLIEGACRWLETRVIPQSDATAATLQDFWADSSPLLEWLVERCETGDPSAKAPAKDLFDDYKAWFEERVPDGKPPTSTAFGRALRDKQFVVFKDNRGNRWRRGIRLLSSAERDGLLGSPDGADTPRPVEPAAQPSRGAGPSADFDEDVP